MRNDFFIARIVIGEEPELMFEDTNRFRDTNASLQISFSRFFEKPRSLDQLLYRGS